MHTLRHLAERAVTSVRWRRLTQRLALDRPAEFWVSRFNPAWSMTELRARVVDILPETADVKSFVLEPNGHWPGHRAGQCVALDVEIDGVRVRRMYSLSSAPAELPTITVKRIAGGRMSSWLHDRVQPGQIVGLGAPTGDFVLPQPAPRRLLFYSGGSGVTPIMAILRDLAAGRALEDVVLVHHARSHADVIFAEELADLAAAHPRLRVHLRLSEELGAAAFDSAWLAQAIPDFARRSTFLCGPPGLMKRVEGVWAGANATGLLTRERFAAPLAEAAPGRPVRVHTGTRTIALDEGRSLLEQLERAGERPAHGCRMGICHTCVCRKRSGTVRNLVTGIVSSAPDEDIRLCISAAQTDLELETETLAGSAS